MNSRHRIVICGESIFLMAIEARLADVPGIDVARLDPHLPTVADRIVALEPDVVVIERDQGHGDLALALLSQGLPLLELDSQQGQATLLTGARVVAAEVDSLMRVLERVRTKRRLDGHSQSGDNYVDAEREH